MKHSEREGSLLAGDLIVVQLHRVDAAAAEFIILRVWTEDAGQQNARATSFGVGHGFRYFSPEKLKIACGMAQTSPATKELHLVARPFEAAMLRFFGAFVAGVGKTCPEESGHGGLERPRYLGT
jgi:hypothetical protein